MTLIRKCRYCGREVRFSGALAKAKCKCGKFLKERVPNPIALPDPLRRQFKAMVNKAGAGFTLKTISPPRRWDYLLVDAGQVTELKLLNKWWIFEGVGLAEGVLYVKPIRPYKDFESSLRDAARRKPPTRGPVRSMPVRLTPPPIGQSPLEIGDQSMESILSRIRELTYRKNDPSAWRDLALGFRVARLRKPLMQALREIGPPKVLKLIEGTPGAWPPEVIAFLREQIALEEERKKRPSSDHELPEWRDLPWYQD